MSLPLTSVKIVPVISVVLQKPLVTFKHDILNTTQWNPKIIQAGNTFLLARVSLNANSTFAEAELTASKTVDSGSANSNYEMNCKMSGIFFLCYIEVPLVTNVISGIMSK